VGDPVGGSVAGGLLDGLTLSYPKAQGLKQSFTASIRDDKIRNEFEIRTPLHSIDCLDVNSSLIWV